MAPIEQNIVSIKNMTVTFKLHSLTQAEQIYAHLKRGLMIGQLKPGQSLIVKDMAEELSVSAMPVREAILKLIGEGLLKVERKKAAYVPDPSLEEFREIAVIRSTVEQLAVETAIPFIGDADIKRIEKINDKVGAAANQNNLELYLEYNWNFHHEICRYCNMPVLIDMIERLMALAGPSLRHYGLAGMKYEKEDWHFEIIKALHSRSKRDAGRAIRKDILSGLEFVEGLREDA